MTPIHTYMAPAKINLGLEVLRKRDDGFHEINTVFARVSLCDEVRLALRSDGEIRCAVNGNDSLQADDTNLCVRAASTLKAFVGRDDLGLDIALEKRIPIGAGLGGGSSDAASVLRGAVELWELEVSDDDLATLAVSLGSDVPFFLLDSAFALGTGRGEVLTPLGITSDSAVALINTGIHVSTPWAYRALGRTGEGKQGSDLAELLRGGFAGDHAALREHLKNDFEEVVFAQHPELAAIKQGLYDAGAYVALMSGSGSTVFGLFDDVSAAERNLGFKIYDLRFKI